MSPQDDPDRAGNVPGLLVRIAVLLTVISGTAAGFGCESSPGTPRYQIGGAIVGLTGNGLVLSTAGQPDLVVLAGATSFRFANAVPAGSPYLVTVASQPTNPEQRCTMSNAVATVGSADVTNIGVSCITRGTFTSTGNMSHGRADTTATLLASGRIVIAGGGYLASAESYEPATGTFATTGAMMTDRDSHTTTLLANGKLLVTGGGNVNAGPLSSAEVYDPSTSLFVATGSMATRRDFHTATLLANRTVLVVGGSDGHDVLPSAELYDATTGRFTATGSLSTARDCHTATLLRNGEVLVAGGFDGLMAVKTSERYDPTVRVFTPTGAMNANRECHTATLLTSGKVLLTGGGSGVGTVTAELYDPVAGTFEATGNMTAPRVNHTATLLADGAVLIVGGNAHSEQGGEASLETAEVYDPGLGTFSATGSLITSRAWHAATLLPEGRVLIAGGYTGVGGVTLMTLLPSAEIYNP